VRFGRFFGKDPIDSLSPLKSTLERDWKDRHVDCKELLWIAVDKFFKPFLKKDDGRGAQELEGPVASVSVSSSAKSRLIL